MQIKMITLQYILHDNKTVTANYACVHNSLTL